MAFLPGDMARFKDEFIDELRHDPDNISGVCMPRRSVYTVIIQAHGDWFFVLCAGRLGWVHGHWMERLW